MNKIRVLQADDHVLVRAGIRALLERIPGIEVVAEASNGREALELIKAHRPDIALLDVAMTEVNGLEVAACIAQDFPSVKVIMLSAYANEAYVLHALKSGAAGYLLKEAAASELALALEAVGRGETYLSSAISNLVVASYLKRGQTEALDQLTSRQCEILRMIVEGKTPKEIAFLLNISVKTVEAHRARVMERLGIHDVPGLVRYAMRIGLIPPEI